MEDTPILTDEVDKLKEHSDASKTEILMKSASENVLGGKKRGDNTSNLSEVGVSQGDVLFKLKEQALDAQVQLKTKHKIIDRLELDLKQKEEQVSSLTRNSDDKLNKLKNLLVHANARISELKDISEKKDKDILKLTESLEETRGALDDLKRKSEMKSETITAVETGIEREVQKAQFQKQKYESSIKTLERRLNEVEQDFQAYQARAQNLLADNSFRLSKDNLPYESQKMQLEIRIAELEKLVLERDTTLQNNLKEMENLKNHTIDKALHDKMVADMTHQKQTIERTLRASLEELRTHFEREKQNDLNRTRSLMEEREKRANVVEQLLIEKEHELSKLNRTLAILTEESLIAKRKESKRIPQSFTKSPGSISPSHEGSHVNGPSSIDPRFIEMSEKLQRDYDSKINRLLSLLGEREDEITKLTEQDNFLKDELRRLDYATRRENLNSEYLKNIILKFFESKDKESLITVLSTVLFLSQEEANRLRSALKSSSPLTLLKQIPGMGVASGVMQSVSGAFRQDPSTSTNTSTK